MPPLALVRWTTRSVLTRISAPSMAPTPVTSSITPTLIGVPVGLVAAAVVGAAAAGALVAAPAGAAVVGLPGACGTDVAAAAVVGAAAAGAVVGAAGVAAGAVHPPESRRANPRARPSDYAS